MGRGSPCLRSLPPCLLRSLPPCFLVAPSPRRPVAPSPRLPVSLSPCLPASLSSVSLLSAQVKRNDNRLWIVACDNDFLFELENQRKGFLIQSFDALSVDREKSEFIFTRQQILNDELSSRVDIRARYALE